MTPTALASAGDLILEVASRLREGGSGMTETDVVAALAATRELTRLVSRVQVEAVAELRLGWLLISPEEHENRLE